jgi:hypothetical protein
MGKFMNHLRLLPFLIVAACAVPRAHAATLSADQKETNRYGAAVICLSLITLSLGSLRARNETFQHPAEH